MNNYILELFYLQFLPAFLIMPAAHPHQKHLG